MVPQTLAVPPVLPTVADASHASPDQRLLALYTRATNPVLDPASWSAAAVALGHRECDYLARPGNTVDGAAVALRAQYSGLTMSMALGMVDAARTAYCPRLPIPVTLLSSAGQT